MVPRARTAIDLVVTAGEVGDSLPYVWDRRVIAPVTSGEFLSNTPLHLAWVSMACCCSGFRTFVPMEECVRSEWKCIGSERKVFSEPWIHKETRSFSVFNNGEALAFFVCVFEQVWASTSELQAF